MFWTFWISSAWITWTESIKGVECEKKKKYNVYTYIANNNGHCPLPIVMYDIGIGWHIVYMYIVYVYRIEHISFLFFSLLFFSFQSMKRFHANTFYSKQFKRLTVPSKSIISFKMIKEIRTILLAIHIFCSYFNWLLFMNLFVIIFFLLIIIILL